MTKEIEDLIRKILARDIELEMLNREAEGKVINFESVLEILKKLTD